jgi:hypothetical protein
MIGYIDKRGEFVWQDAYVDTGYLKIAERPRPTEWLPPRAKQ